MAGGSKLGSIYVELSLDDKIYKQKLASMPADAQATTKGLETSWRSLGVKTNQYFDDSRKAAENAYRLIEKSGKYSAEEILRAERAKNETITRLNEQQFGKQTSALSTLKSHYLAVTAAIAVAVGAIAKAWSLAKEGADFKEQEGILNNLARKYDMTADDIVAAMEKASDGLVSRADLMSIALGGLAKGLDPTQLTDLADAARLLGDTVGMSATESLKQLTTALETGRTKGLKMFMGSAIDLETTMGDLYQKMTEAEKTQALYSITMMEAAKLQAQMTGEVNDAGDKIERLEATWANVKTTVSVFTMETMVGLFDAFAYLGRTVTEQDEIIDEFGQSVDVASLSTETLASKIWQWAVPAFNSWMETEEEAEKRILATMNTTDIANKSLTSHTDNINDDADANKALIAPYQATIDKLKDQIKSREGNKKAIKDGAKAAQKAAEAEKKLAQEIRDSWKKIYLDMSDYEDDQDAEREKYLKEFEKDSADTAKEIKDTWRDIYQASSKWEEEQDAEREKYLKAFADKKKEEEKIAQDTADKRSTAMRAMYKDLDGYEGQYYTSMKKMIEKQRQDYEKLTGDKVASEKWATNQLELLDIEKGKSSDNFFDGIKAGYEEAKKNAKGFGDYGYEIFKTFAESSKTAISTTLFDAIKTGTVDMKAVWTTFSDAILKKFTDTVADMVVSWGQKGIATMITTGDTFWKTTASKLADLGTDSATTFGEMASKFGSSILSMISAAGQKISMVFSAAWDAASALVLAGIKALSNWFNSYEGGYVRTSGIGSYASGGSIVPGRARVGGDSLSNDTVLAMLSPGEYVMPRTAVNAETLPHLEYMREHKQPRGYADGGYVDQLPGLTQSWTGDMHWYDDDEWEKLEDVYKMIHDYAGLTYYNGQWGRLGYKDSGEGLYPVSFASVNDPIVESGKYINERFGYNLQDENVPPQPLDSEDYKYLLNWWGSSMGLGNYGWGEGGNWSWESEHGFNPVTGSMNPNVVWSEAEGDGYRFYMRDGSDYYADPSESNFLKRWMPGIIKVIGQVAAIVIATAAALPTGGTSYGLLAGLEAAIQGGMASAAAIAGGIGAGAYTGLVSYGETGSVTGSVIAGIISAVTTALSFGSPWAQSETGLYVLKSELEAGGYLTAAQGRIIADTIRKGGATVLEETLDDVIHGGGSMALSKSGDGGGLDDLSGMFEGLPSEMSGSVSLARGLDYVPYDNFPARLHKGERVVPANENRSGGNVFHIYLDGEEIRGRMRIIADKVFVDRASSGIGSLQRVYA